MSLQPTRYASPLKHGKRRSIKDSPLFRARCLREIKPVTVCISAHCKGMVLFAADRMITAGDTQFEPEVPKIRFLTSSIAVMFSGDADFHTEILNDVVAEVQAWIKNNPGKWLEVKQATELYVRFCNDAKSRRSEAAILAPLRLTHTTWLEKQKIMDSDLVASVASDLINFQIPRVNVIIAGVNLHEDNLAYAHTYTYDTEDGSVACLDSVAFAAVGSGARHAESQFMLARHTWNRPLAETLMLIYSAKRDAEIAPGVGKDTDFWAIGPYVGQWVEISKEIKEKLEEEYKKIKAAQSSARAIANAEVTTYVDSISKTPAEEQSKSPTKEGSAPTEDQKSEKSD
jgi:hypothetical protein